MLEKLPVSEVEANGKVYRQFDSPVVNIQLVTRTQFDGRIEDTA